MMATDQTSLRADSDGERLLKALRFAKTDRVPNWEGTIEARTVEHFIGKKVRSSDLSMPDAVALALRTGMDAIHAPAPRTNGNVRGLGEIWRTEEDGSTSYLGGSVRGREDLARFDLDALRQEWLRAAEAMIDEALAATRGTRLGVAGRLNGPFWVSQISMGLSEFLIATHEDPELVRTLMDFYAEFDRAVAQLIVRKGLPLVYVADDLAHTRGLQVSPAWLDKWWYPRMRSIMEVITAAGIPSVFHSCGKLERVIPYLVRLGCSAVQALQPNCNDIYEVRRRYGKQIALMGNIDITYPMSEGTPEDVRRDVLEHLEQLGPEGGYIVSTSHSVLNSIPPANYVAMVQTVQGWRAA